MSADQQQMIDQLLAQTTVSPQQSFMGVSAAPDQSQLQNLLSKLKQQQFQQQALTATPEQFRRASMIGVGQQLGGIAQQQFGPPPAAPTQSPQASLLMQARAKYANDVAQGVPENEARQTAAKALVQAGFPAAPDVLEKAVSAGATLNHLNQEAFKEQQQGLASQDEPRHRGVEEAHWSNEEKAAQRRLDIEQENATTNSNKAAATSAGANMDEPATPAEMILARKMADGDMAVPNVSARNPKGARLASFAFQMNPDLTQQTYPTRQAAAKAIGPGKAGDQVRSFNVAYSHLDTAQEAFDALQNGNMKLANALANRIAMETGQPAPTNADTTLSMIKGELAKGIIGSHAGEQDRKDMLAGANSSNAPDVLYGVANQARQLLLGQASGVKHQYEPLMGGHYKFVDALSPKFKNDLLAYETKADAAAAGPDAKDDGWQTVNGVKIREKK